MKKKWATLLMAALLATGLTTSAFAAGPAGSDRGRDNGFSRSEKARGVSQARYEGGQTRHHDGYQHGWGHQDGFRNGWSRQAGFSHGWGGHNGYGYGHGGGHRHGWFGHGWRR